MTASGKDKDEFHFTVPTDEWEALSLSGLSSGYGFTLAVVSATPSREVMVLYNQSGSPAAQANLNRSARILAVDGVDLINGNDVDTINAGLFPESDSESHDFTVMDFGSTEEPMLAMALQYRETGSYPTSSEKAQRKQGP